MTQELNPYIFALKKLMTDKSQRIQNGFLMLQANYRAEGRKITASRLAKAAGYKSYVTGNEQYGSFAHKICELMGFEPEQKRDGVPIWTYAICDESEETDKYGYLQWILKKDVADALEQLGIVTATPDLFSDIEEKRRA